MSLRRLVFNTLLSGVEPAVLLTAFLILYLVTVVAGPYVSDALNVSVGEYLATGSVILSLHAFFASLSLIGFLSILVSLFLTVFLVGFVASRVIQRRLGTIKNPFSRALERWLSVFAAATLVALLPVVLFLAYMVYQPYPVAGLLLTLYYLSLLLWVPLSLPVLAAAVAEKKGRDAVHEGLLAGRVYWWKILVAMMILSLLVFFLGYLLASLATADTGLVVDILLYSLLLAWLVSLAAEAYVLFKRGE